MIYNILCAEKTLKGFCGPYSWLFLESARAIFLTILEELLLVLNVQVFFYHILFIV